MDFLNDQIQYLGLIFSRIMALFSVAPILAGQSIPVRIRMILALLLAIILYPVVIHSLNVLPESMGHYILQIFSHAVIGIVIGFMILILFAAFQMSGDVFAIQMGFSFSQVLDPQSNVSSPIIGILKNSIATLIFLAVPFSMDGYYLPALLHLVRVIAYSFDVVPILNWNEITQFGILQYLNDMVGLMLITALKLGIPMIGILFISSVTLGLLGKAAPQMNLMSMGIQTNIMVGLFVLIFLMPVIVPIMLESFIIMYDHLGALLNNWA